MCYFAVFALFYFVFEGNFQVYHTDNEIYKIFDSRARDECSRYVFTCRSTIHSGLSTVFPGYTLTW